MHKFISSYVQNVLLLLIYQILANVVVHILHKNYPYSYNIIQIY